MIVISNPITIQNEIKIIHSLFEEGLSLFHVRKPHFSEIEMNAFVSEIGLEFRNQLVLHQYHDLASSFGIDKLHFSEKNRTNFSDSSAKTLSTSSHSIEDFNVLNSVFDYAFLSPIFPSISKENYSPKTNAFVSIKKRTNFSTKLIALGGLSAENIKQTLKNGFDDVALLGSIWSNTNPIGNFKKCQQIVLSQSL